MKKGLKTLESLKDSRILFDKQPPAFGYFLLITVVIILCMIFLWSVRTPKIYMIQAQGTVTDEDANYVMCTYTGEIDYFNMEEGMLVEKGDVLFTVKSTDYDLQEEQLIENRKAYEKQISQNELLVQSIKDDTNYFDESDPEDSLYYNTFQTYKSKVAQSNLDASTYSQYGYDDEQIEAEIIKNQGKIDEIYFSTIQSAESTIEQANQQIASINAQLAAISSGQEAYAVKATASGILHLMGNYKSGMVVQTSSTVATITPENANRIIEAYVSTADMARMNEGDIVQITVDGLAQSVYGNITGRVKKIDTNINVQEGQDGSRTQVFKVLIAMDSDYLVSKSGDKVNVSNGMTAVARIQYDKVTYFNYGLEKLGFKAR